MEKLYIIHACILVLLKGIIQAAPLVDTKDAIAQAVAAVSTSNTSPNVSVVLHSPVIVPAMSFPDGMLNSTVPASVESPKPTTEEPRQPLAPEMFNSGFALVNGTPVFLHASPVTGEKVMEAVGEPWATTPVSVTEAVKVVEKNVSLTKEQAQEKDSASVAHSVMKAMEHLNNISQQQADRNITESINSGTSVVNSSALASNTSSVSVVVVPLIQNAFDMVDDKSPSAAQMAANHPLVFSEKNGTHTTLHVVVKRDAIDHRPIDIADHNSHGMLTSTDFLGGGLIASNNSSVVSSAGQIVNSSHITLPLNNTSIQANVSRPSENSHGPLNDDDFTTSASAHLVTEKILIELHNETVNQAKNLTIGELVTEHVGKFENSSAMVNATPFVKAEPASHQVNVSLLLPSALVPVGVKVIQTPMAQPAHSAPLFFFKVASLAPESERVMERTQPVHEPPVDLSTVASVLAVNVSTLPSAPRVPLDIQEPVLASKPLPPGTFAFVPIQEKTNATEAKLLRMEV